MLFVVLCREHDKGPEMFCSLLAKLVDHELHFVVSVLGSCTTDIPSKFNHRLKLNWIGNGHTMKFGAHCI